MQHTPGTGVEQPVASATATSSRYFVIDLLHRA
jgi:hypothetical protein